MRTERRGSEKGSVLTMLSFLGEISTLGNGEAKESFWKVSVRRERD
jgi:hypothetical protein